MNKTIFIGRISSDLNIKYTPNGNSVCEFNLAVNRPIKKDKEKETDFINCVIWGKQAENLVNYQQKGNMIAVDGRYQIDKYQNEQGENRYKHYILVNTIQFLESKKEEITIKQEKEETDLFQNFRESNDDDMPW